MAIVKTEKYAYVCVDAPGGNPVTVDTADAVETYVNGHPSFKGKNWVAAPVISYDDE